MKLNKLTALLLAGVLALGLLSGCGGNEQAPESAAPESAAPAEGAERTDGGENGSAEDKDKRTGPALFSAVPDAARIV